VEQMKIVAKIMMMMMMMMLFVTADMARYQDIVKWFHSEPPVCDVALHSRFFRRSCNSSLE